jgi:hypothetical protein
MLVSNFNQFAWPEIITEDWLCKFFFRGRIKIHLRSHVSARDKYFHAFQFATWLASAIHSLPFHLRIRSIYVRKCVCMLSGDYSSLPIALRVERTSLAGTHLCWVALPPTMISNGRDAKKMCGKMNPLSRLGIAPNLCARPINVAGWNLKSLLSGAARRKNVLGSSRLSSSHAPDVCCFVSELTFVRSLVCCTFNFCYSTLDFAHSRGPLFGLSHTRAANLIDNETWAFYRK